MCLNRLRGWVVVTAACVVAVYGCVGDEPNPATAPAADSGASSSGATSASSSGTSGTSSGTGSSSSGSSGDAGPACSPTGDFGNGVEVPGIHADTQSETSLRFSTDLISAVISRGNPGRLFIADRSDPLQPFGTGTDLGATINLPGGVGRATFADDRKTLYFEGTETSPSTTFNLYYSTRTTTADPWETAKAIPSLSGFGAHYAPYFRNGTLYLMHNDGTHGQKLYYAKRKAGSVADFEDKVELTGLAGGDWPVVTSNELTIFFIKDGSVWQATRSQSGDAFGEPKSLPASINTPTGHEHPTDISADGCTLYFARYLDGSTQRIYQAQRAK